MTTNPNAIVTAERVAVEEVKRLVNIVVALRNDVFVQGVDFGVIPGTGDKPTLLQPGMEKLMRALHLRAEYVERSRIEDFDKAMFFYRYECRLMDWETGICVGTAIGSANSHESKWRWRDAKRVCPKCGKETINRSKFPPKGAPEGTEPGWYCYAKLGGCGAEFSAKDPQITGQTIGRVENPDIFDQMNTCDKIAQKRALASAIKTVANVSMLYTVDLEDFQPYDTRPPAGEYVEGAFTVVETGKSPEQPSASVRGAGIGNGNNSSSSKAQEAEPMQTAEPPATQDETRTYQCDALTIQQAAGKDGARSYVFHAKSRQNIVITDPAVLDDLNSIAPRAWKAGRYPLTPSVLVTAWADAEGWHVEKLADALPA